MPGGDTLPICKTCGVQYAAPREDCPICDDERQYVGWDGQQWTTLEALRRDGYRSDVRPEGARVIGIGTAPSFGIGQRALLVQADAGNVLWDCITYLDDELVAKVQELGGVSAIAVSHPHFYGSMVEWAHAFEAHVYIHTADRAWVGRPDPRIVFWEGDTHEVLPRVTLVNAGIHFAGGTVMHWAAPSEGSPATEVTGALFSGDIFAVALDRDWLSFMYSYPNYIPERPSTVRRALEVIAPFRFERIYGAFWGRVTPSGGEVALRRSAERYLRFALDEK
jgi:hypothetical protein